MAAEIDLRARMLAMEALARGASQAEAARASGYSRMQVSRLLRDPDFLAEVTRRRASVQGEPPDPDELLALATLRRIAKEGADRDALAAAAKLVEHARERQRLAPPAAPSPPAFARATDEEVRRWMDTQT